MSFQTASSNDYTSNLLFMRRRQAVTLLLSLVEKPDTYENLPTKNLLLDALNSLPTECFIADDWSKILIQITTKLIKKTESDLQVPTALSNLLANVQYRLQLDIPSSQSIRHLSTAASKD